MQRDINEEEGNNGNEANNSNEANTGNGDNNSKAEAIDTDRRLQ